MDIQTLFSIRGKGALVAGGSRGLGLFLASRSGAFTVGEVITCDGGTVVS